MRLASGRARLVIRPVATGSAPVRKTIGIVEVAPFAANIGGLPPAVITSTLRVTSSAANAGGRS